MDRIRAALKPMSVSVLICSHNGQARIAATLESLAKCEASFPVEVILIDNNSTDGTAQTAIAVWTRLNSSFKFRVIVEPELGLAYARRRGVMEATHDFLVFCDDDNWLCRDYLSIVVEVLSDPRVGAAGGQVEPVFEGSTPSFAYSHGDWLALGIQALASGDVTHSRGFLWGAGLAVRRSDLRMIYECPFFPISTGRVGASSVSSGDDSEICWALTVLGKTLVYDSRLKLQHFMPQERLEIEYLRRLVDAGWDQRFRRFAIGLDAIRKSSRVTVGFKSTVRWLRYYRRPEERHYYASILLAACGWYKIMGDLERKLYVAFQWLSARRAVGRP
jgi:glycosyltransferase involved in cell wall biosynthesis